MAPGGAPSPPLFLLFLFTLAAAADVSPPRAAPVVAPDGVYNEGSHAAGCNLNETRLAEQAERVEEMEVCVGT